MGSICGADARLRWAITAGCLLSLVLQTARAADEAAPAGRLASANDEASQANVFVDRDPLSLSSGAGEIWSLAYSADDKFLAAAGGGRWDNQDPGYVRIWDMATEKVVASYNLPRGVMSIAISPDGQRVAFSGWDNKVTLREVGGRELLSHATTKNARVAFSPDGNLLVVGDKDKGLAVFDGRTGSPLEPFQGNTLECFWTGFSADGKLLVVVGGSKEALNKPQIGVWDVASRAQLFTFADHPNEVHKAAISPDGKTLAACCNKEIWLWDLEKGSLRQKLETNHAYVQTAAFSPDGAWLASGGSAGAIFLWDTASWQRTGAALAGNSGETRALVFSRDSKTLVSGAADFSIRLWDVATASQRSFLQQPLGGNNSELQVLAVAYSPDGAHVATASEDGRVGIYDVASGKLLNVWKAHSDAAACLAYSPDGKTLASGGYDKAVKLWEPESGNPIRTLAGHKGWVVSLAFSHDGQVLASGSYDRSVALWNTVDGAQRSSLAGHTATVRSVAFSPDDKLLASGGADRRVKLWDVSTGQEQADLQSHAGAVRGVAFSPDGKLLASGSEDRMVKVWNVDSHDLRHTLKGHTDMVSAVAFAGSTLLSASWDHTILMWDPTAGESRGRLDTRQDAVIALAVSPDGKRLITVNASRAIRLWKSAEAGSRPLATFGKYRNYPWTATFSPDGGSVAVGAGGDGDETDLYIYDLATAKERIHAKFSGNVRSMAYAPAGDLMALGFLSNELLLVDAATGKEVASFDEHHSGVNSVAFSPDGSMLATGSFDKNVRVYGVPQRALINTFSFHTDGVLSVTFRPDSKDIVSGGRDRMTVFWSLAENVRRYNIPPQQGQIECVAVSNDSVIAATGSSAGECKLWHVETGLQIKSLPAHQGTVMDVRFAPDGKRMLTAGIDGMVRVWDYTTGKSLVTYFAHTGGVNSARFSPDGKTILSAGKDGWARLWPVPPLESPEADKQ